MNDLIHRIVEIIIEAGQSDTKKFRLGETIRYSPSEILEILKQHENEIFGEGSSTQTNAFNTLNALDCISRSMALAEIRHLYPSAPSINFRGSLVRWSEKNKQYIECEEAIRRLPSAQPERKTGKWIEDRLISTGGGTYGVRRCSECEAYYQDVGYGWNYCPNCGAKMEE